MKQFTFIVLNILTGVRPTLCHIPVLNQLPWNNLASLNRPSKLNPTTAKPLKWPNYQMMNECINLSRTLAGNSALNILLPQSLLEPVRQASVKKISSGFDQRDV